MNALLLLIFGILVFGLGYYFYASKIASLFDINPHRATPAVSKYDGVDYVPAKNWLVLFGHHFSSIAGAGPIIGPVIGCIYWGWLPSLLWVVLGAVLIGGVHDFVSLMISVREGGDSVAEIAGKVVSPKAKLIFSVFVWLALILVIAVFATLCAETFVTEPKVVLPSLGLIPVAILIGFMIYIKKANLTFSTILGLALLAGLLFLGEMFPIALGSHAFMIWVLVLLVYCFVASVTPVNILLQPRDYLSSYLLFFGIAAGFTGIVTARPALTTPAYVAWDAAEGPLWPILFVTVACGAISGFHSLVAAGTTSKQIASERDANRIGYGGMVVEALVAIVAVIAVAGGFASFAAMKSAVANGGPVNAFGEGFGFLTRFIFGKYGSFIAIILLNSFILTTLDTATRIARYILQELFGTLDRYLATSVIVLAGGWLAMTGEWRKIWPVFGAANQLVAALTLIIISSWLLSRKKRADITMAPAVFMLLTTIGALAWQFGKFVSDHDWVLVWLDMGLMILALAMMSEIYAWWRCRHKRSGPQTCPRG